MEYDLVQRPYENLDLSAKVRLVALASFTFLIAFAWALLLLFGTAFAVLSTRLIHEWIDSALSGAVSSIDKHALDVLQVATRNFTDSFLRSYAIDISVIYIATAAVTVAISFCFFWGFHYSFQNPYRSALEHLINHGEDGRGDKGGNILIAFTRRQLFYTMLPESVGADRARIEVEQLFCRDQSSWGVGASNCPCFKRLGKEGDYVSFVRCKMAVGWVVLASVMFALGCLSATLFVCSLRLIPTSMVLLSRLATLISAQPSYAYVVSHALQMIGMDTIVSDCIKIGYWISGLAMTVCFVLGTAALVYGLAYETYKPIALESALSIPKLYYKGPEGCWKVQMPRRSNGGVNLDFFVRPAEDSKLSGDGNLEDYKLEAVVVYERDSNIAQASPPLIG